MNQFTFNSMIAAIRDNKKIEAIKYMRQIVCDHQENLSDNTEGNLKFAKDFIEAVMEQMSVKQATVEQPHYRFALAYKEYGKDAEYESHLSEVEALRKAQDFVSNETIDLDYCHVVEMKQIARSSHVYKMKPIND